MAMMPRRASSQQGWFMKTLTILPLTVFPFLLYLFFAIFGGASGEDGTPGVQGVLDSTLFGIPMISGVRWEFRIGDLILLIGLMFLSIEVIKATSAKSSSMMNHAGSMVVFILAMIGFFVFSSFATSVFFFLMLMTLVDVLAGSMITIVSARRDFGVGDGVGQ